MTPQPCARTPAISVVVVPLGGRAYLTRCLEALTFQVGVQNVETLVPCDDRISDVAGLQKQFPAVKLLRVEGHRTYAELRALGVREARAAIVALSEDHCIPDPDWCAQILQAHTAVHAAVGGPVEKKAPDAALNWALYLADYARYMNPMLEGLSDQLTDCNVSYKRSALHAISDVWRDEFHEPAVHGALRARGETLWFSPQMIVRQQRSLRFGDAVRDRYAFGRLFGSERVTRQQAGKSEEQRAKSKEQGGKSKERGAKGAEGRSTPGALDLTVSQRKQEAGSALLRRLLYAGFTILLPALLTGRVAGHVLRRRRHVGAFISALPSLVLLNTAWAWGEFAGYVTGRPDPSLTPQGGAADARPRENAAL